MCKRCKYEQYSYYDSRTENDEFRSSAAPILIAEWVCAESTSEGSFRLLYEYEQGKYHREPDLYVRQNWD